MAQEAFSSSTKELVMASADAFQLSFTCEQAAIAVMESGHGKMSLQIASCQLVLLAFLGMGNIESPRLEKPSKIIQSNHLPTTISH